jgi:GTP-binding protein
MADIPGLIEGASEGLGLGHDFLRHIDRCRLLVHIVDVSGCEGRDPVEDLAIIDRELLGYSAELASRPQIVVAGKCDALDPASDNLARLEARAKELGRPFLKTSAATGEGLRELVSLASEMLSELPPQKEYEPEVTTDELALEAISEDVRKTTVRREGDVFYVEGKWLVDFMGRIDFGIYEQLEFFQRVLRKNGVIDLLRENGIEEGNTVNIYDFEFDFVY